MYLERFPIMEFLAILWSRVARAVESLASTTLHEALSSSILWDIHLILNINSLSICIANHQKEFHWSSYYE